MHFSAKCNSSRIDIQWLHIKHYLDYQDTKLQLYTFRVQKMCVFARYASLVPRLNVVHIRVYVYFLIKASDQKCLRVKSSFVFNIVPCGIQMKIVSFQNKNSKPCTIIGQFLL